jgi:transcriptional regulator NrdR family protein
LGNKKVDCPRCLGKGNVDLQDIKRLHKELYWGTGKCAYCNGVGKVPSKIALSECVEITYLTTDLSKRERKKLLNGNKRALQRAKQFQTDLDEIAKQIEHLYYTENLEPDKIAEHLIEKYGRRKYSAEDIQQTIEYVEKVIKSKLSKE